MNPSADDADPIPSTHDDAGSSGLSSAHRGYVYQDVATAYFFASAIADNLDQIVVDKKENKGDLFDDLTLVQAGRRVRRQFKSSADSNKPFAAEALKTKTNDLRLDDIVHCFLNAGANPADEYRICTTWSMPKEEDVAQLLLTCNAPTSFEGHPTRTYRLNVDEIWPEGGELIWNLRNGRHFSRNDLLHFSARLVIELECPQISLDVLSPGPLQVLLHNFLSERIGVGRYPNRRLSPQSTAANLILRASLARAQQESLTTGQIIRELGLRTDFGRISQKFPVVHDHQVTRDTLLDDLRREISKNAVVILTGSPGSGKSWLLSRLADTCAGDEFLIARHYCFLNPVDEYRNRRITIDALFGNLIAELADAVPKHHRTHGPLLSAGPSELEGFLASVHEENPNRQILLIVDGLDHIERVLAESQDITAIETRIVEELASLRLPPGVCLLVGSQPGVHLAPLTAIAPAMPITGWTQPEIKELASRLGALQAIEQTFNESEAEQYIKALHSRSVGNPLYATYLCRDTLLSVESGRNVNPTSIVDHAPDYDNDLKGYYTYLVGGGAPEVVASVLAFVDFAITKHELESICPLISPHIASQLLSLSPVLTEVSSQGGLRVYHESFRRFILNANAQFPAHRDTILESISSWLALQGFFKDARAFRHLLRYLLRRGKFLDALSYVDVTFVSESVKHCFTYEPILSNVNVAAEAALVLGNWPALCRLSEIRKSIDTCFSEKLDFTTYVKASLALTSPSHVADQLLFEGRPVHSRDEGLIACSLCDNNGGVPPWEEYLRLDGARGVRGREEAAVAEFHGRARTSNANEIILRVADWLKRLPVHSVSYARRVLSRLTDVHGVQSLQAIVSDVDLPRHAKYLLQISISKNVSTTGGAAHRAAATAAAELASDICDAIECVECGAEPAAVAHFLPADLGQATRELTGLENPDAEATRHWLSAIQLGALLQPSQLTSMRDTIEVRGWYSAWLKFAMSVAISTSRTVGETRGREICDALKELSCEDNPFRGQPRACDLYSIESEILETWKRALALIQGTAELREAMLHLSSISASITTYLQGSPGGPLTMEALVSLAETLLSRNDALPIAIEAIKEQLERVETGFYEIQSGLEMRLAVAHAVALQRESAAYHWERACRCLVGYGFRKDVTVFELINSLPILIAADAGQARVGIRDLQKLIESLDGRTDGRETRGALVDWFKCLVLADPTKAAYLLARSMLRDGGVVSWRLESCLIKLLQHSQNGSHRLLLALAFTSSNESGEGFVGSVLPWIRQELETSRAGGLSAWHRFVQYIQQSSSARDSAASRSIDVFAREHGLPAIAYDTATTDSENEVNDVVAVSDKEGDPQGSRQSAISKESSLAQFARNIGQLGYGINSGNLQEQTLVECLCFFIDELISKGREEDATWLIRLFAVRSYYRGKTQVLTAIGERYESIGQTDFAAMAFTFAGWCEGERIWFTEFTDTQLELLKRGWEVNELAAAATIVGRAFDGITGDAGYYFGLSCRLVDIATRLRNSQNGFECWQETFRAIEHRLPEWQTVQTEMEALDLDKNASWQLDDALAYLLISRLSHPDLQRRQSALADVSVILCQDPSVFEAGVREVIENDSPLASKLLLLSAILECELTPFALTRAVAEPLGQLRKSEYFGLRAISERLLSRISS